MLPPWNFTLHRDHSKKLYYEFGGHFILVDNGGPLLLVGERGFWYVPLTLVATWPASCLICYYLVSLMVCSGHNKDTLYPFVTICDILLWVKLQTNLPVAAGHGNCLYFLGCFWEKKIQIKFIFHSIHLIVLQKFRHFVVTVLELSIK
jgi:hypothetical protein